jgi:hypothetical protein
MANLNTHISEMKFYKKRYNQPLLSHSLHIRSLRQKSRTFPVMLLQNKFVGVLGRVINLIQQL